MEIPSTFGLLLKGNRWFAVGFPGGHEQFPELFFRAQTRAWFSLRLEYLQACFLIGTFRPESGGYSFQQSLELCQVSFLVAFRGLLQEWSYPAIERVIVSGALHRDTYRSARDKCAGGWIPARTWNHIYIFRWLHRPSQLTSSFAAAQLGPSSDFRKNTTATVFACKLHVLSSKPSSKLKSGLLPNQVSSELPPLFAQTTTLRPLLIYSLT